jgi:hypothetical protein
MSLECPTELTYKSSGLDYSIGTVYEQVFFHRWIFYSNTQGNNHLQMPVRLFETSMKVIQYPHSLAAQQKDFEDN